MPARKATAPSSGMPCAASARAPAMIVVDWSRPSIDMPMIG